MSITLYKLSKYLKIYKLDLLVVIISLTCVSISLLMIGSVFRQLVDYGLKENNIGSINKYILLIYIFMIILSISSFFRSYFINNITEKIINQIKVDAYSNIINFDIAYIEELKVGDIISCLTIDIALVEKLIINLLSFLVRNLIMLIGGIILMFLQSYKLTLMVITIIPLLLVPLMKLGKYVRTLSKNSLDMQAIITSKIEESFSNIRVIHSFNQQTNKISDFTKQIFFYLELVSSRLKIRSLFFSLSILVILSSITIVIWVGSINIVQSNLSSGQMISFIYYAIIVGVSSGGIFELLSELHLPLAALVRVFSLVDYSVEHQEIDNNLESFNDKKLPISIELQNIYFSYKSRPHIIVLNNISFKITYGKFIGIVGRSGSGKSTLMQLLLKFYLPTKGLIKFFNQDILINNIQQIRRLIAYVPQDPSIFSGTIRTNIIFSKPNVSENEIINVANITGIMDYVKDFKDGLDTQIGEKGVKLSGGQKQRIAIARAILYNPEILLLDEATSALDSEGEQKLINTIQRLMKGKTIISIAHRISSIEQADEILVIDQGSLIAQGTHSTLLTSSEIYQIICAEQAIDLKP